MRTRNAITVSFLLLLFNMILISCVTQNTDPIPVESVFLNEQIKLRAASYLNTFKTGDAVYLELKYNTNRKIVFPNNYNLRIFYKLDNEWAELKEKPTQRYPEGEIVFSPTVYMPATEVVPVLPDLPSRLKEYDLRIYVMGHMEDKDKLVEVFAYAVIALRP
jgi:hypothetical protein